ncbi:uncharacterized protein KD926_009499 [Aspergillus affinis]|uniref:uncharacterized protein n=1 Tax=Aspergillus affinis TaxID=1070780 RepID=UPI0022FF2C60|nr:uncharacterized protein KD926_009499 [Aspergillus affinis]KAI9039356.1 hypothetical protein KD926_009499 [Aspergillus affinis]
MPFGSSTPTTVTSIPAMAENSYGSSPSGLRSVTTPSPASASSSRETPTVTSKILPKEPAANTDTSVWRLERSGNEKITDIRILRRDHEVNYDTVRSLGFEGISTDINDGRGKSFLYLVWKSE